MSGPVFNPDEERIIPASAVTKYGHPIMEQINTGRFGHGRWTPTHNPTGVLWLTDNGHVGFQPAPGVDPTPIVLDPAHNAVEAYNAAKAEFGAGREIVGDVGTWMADQPRRT